MAALDHACERQDRDPATVHRSTQAFVLVSDDASRVAEVRSEHDGARPVLAGTAAEVADQLGAYARVGADEFIVPTFLMGSGAELEDALGALWSGVGQAGLLDA